MLRKLTLLGIVFAAALQVWGAEPVAVRNGPAVGTKGAASQPILVPLPPKLPVIVQAAPVKDAPAGEVNFLAMGDWGQGTADQRKVAETLAVYSQKIGKIQCLLTAGDNFYVRMPLGVADPAWRTIFEDMYDAKRMTYPWFASLGNHDFEFGKAPIEIQYAREHPESRWKLPARWYRLDVMANGSEKPVASVLMLDSNQQVATNEEWEAQKAWMDQQLGSIPPGTWTICCSHHPPFTNGDHGDNGKLQVDWGPILKKHNVDVYVAGHDHDLQHLEIPGWTQSFLLVGGGGGRIRPMLIDKRGPFSRMIYGFAHFTITPEKLLVHYVGENLEDLHTFERTKAGKVTIISTTSSDKATDKKLKTIQGIEGNKKSGDD